MQGLSHRVYWVWEFMRRLCIQSAIAFPLSYLMKCDRLSICLLVQSDRYTRNMNLTYEP
ncbi:MAG: hypothetical protein ACFCUV_15580 [Rivularia sp. (in: cyanobacteria)]